MLFDGHALIYRAYHAFPVTLTTPDGRVDNAVYGFTRILLHLLEDRKPDYVAVAFDSKEKTFRHEAFADYKANRAEMPDDLKPQIAMVQEVVDTLNVPKFVLPGYEADDLIGTVSRIAQGMDEIEQVVVVTGDRDLLQLVTEKTHILMPPRGKNNGEMEYDENEVIKKYSVTPAQFAQLKAIMGDTSDNIPGIKGIGPKTAGKLMIELGSLDKIIEVAKNGGTVEGVRPAHMEQIAQSEKLLRDNLQLTTINTQAPIDFNVESCKLSGYKKQDAIKLFEELGFKSLIKNLPADDFELGLQEALF